MPARRPDALVAALLRLAPEEGEHETRVPGLVLFRLHEPTSPVALFYRPSLCVIAQGRKAVTLEHEVFHYDPATYMLVSAHVPMTGHVMRASHKEPYLALRIGLEPALVAEVAAEIDAVVTPPARAVAVSKLEPALLDALVRYVSLLENDADRRVLAPLVLREIVYRLLVGPQGDILRQMCSGEGQARRIDRALGWLRAHYAEPLRVESLAREVGMSASALHQHFKNVTAMSPLQYQKRLRLHEARRLMVAEGLDAAEASYRVGYESPSHFSREFRRVFGAPPRRSVAGSADARRSAARLPTSSSGGPLL